MAAHKKGLWSEVVVPKKIFFVVNGREQFFPSFLYFKKVVAASHSKMDTVFILEYLFYGAVA